MRTRARRAKPSTDELISMMATRGDAMRRASVDLLMPEGAMGFEDLGMNEITPLEDIGSRYLIRFRQMSAFVDDDSTVVKQPVK